MKKLKYSESVIANIHHWHKGGKTKKWIMGLYGMTLRQVNNALKQYKDEIQKETSSN